jgi:flagellar biosynthetic protein FliR
MLTSVLENLIAGQIYTFIMLFVRVGAAVMIMPTIGDSFVASNIRLMFALALSVIMTPVLEPHLPTITVIGTQFMLLILMEGIIGLFIGGIARILIAALDIAGMFISMQMGLANAQVFNPGFATQGSLVGAFLSITGVVLLFATNMHHLLIYAIYDSYVAFPPGALPETGGMAQMMAMTLSQSFLIGFKLAVPFMVVALMTYIGMGVMSRVMPQIQVFMLALPLQIVMGMFLLLLVFSSIFLVWLQYFEDGMMFFLNNTGSKYNEGG